MIYFWFGLLKVLGLSPAEALVYDLFNNTLAWLLPFTTFYMLFGLFECLIGVMYLLRGLEKYALIFTLVHVFTTSLPLIVLPLHTWGGFLIPTLTGQYIIKNLLIVGAGFSVYKRRLQNI